MKIYVINSDNGLVEAYINREEAVASAVKYIKEDPCYKEISEYDYNIEDDIDREIDCGYHCYEFWVESLEVVEPEQKQYSYWDGIQLI